MAIGGFSSAQDKFGQDSKNDLLDVSLDSTNFPQLSKYEGEINQWFDKKFEEILKTENANILKDMGLDLGDNASEGNFADAIDTWFDQHRDQPGYLQDLIAYLADGETKTLTEIADIKTELMNLDLEITADGLRAVKDRLDDDKDLDPNDASPESQRETAVHSFVGRYLSYFETSNSSRKVLADQIAGLFDKNGFVLIRVYSENQKSLLHKIKPDILVHWLDLYYKDKDLVLHGVEVRDNEAKVIELRHEQMDPVPKGCGNVHSESAETFHRVPVAVDVSCSDCVEEDNPIDRAELRVKNYKDPYNSYSFGCPDFPYADAKRGYSEDENQKSDIKNFTEEKRNNLSSRQQKKHLRKAAKNTIKYLPEIERGIDYYHDMPLGVKIGKSTTTVLDRKALKSLKKNLRKLGWKGLSVLAGLEHEYNTGALQKELGSVEAFDTTDPTKKQLRALKKSIRKQNKSGKDNLLNHFRRGNAISDGSFWNNMLGDGISGDSDVSKKEAKALFELSCDFVRYKDNSPVYPGYQEVIGHLLSTVNAKGGYLNTPDAKRTPDKVDNRHMITGRNRINDLRSHEVLLKDKAKARLSKEVDGMNAVNLFLRHYEESTNKNVNDVTYKKKMKSLLKKKPSLLDLGVFRAEYPDGPRRIMAEARAVGMSMDDMYDAWMISNRVNISVADIARSFDGTGFDRINSKSDNLSKRMRGFLETGKKLGSFSEEEKLYSRSTNHRCALWLLSDYNFDSKVTSQDGGTKPGVMLTTAFHDAVTDLKMHPDFASDVYRDDPDKVFDESLVEREKMALCNMLDYIRQQFELKDYNVLLDHIGTGVTNPENLWFKMSQSPALVYAMQNILKNTPRELNDIFRFGADNDSREASEKGLERNQAVIDLMDKSTASWMGQLDSQWANVSQKLTEEQKKQWDGYRNQLESGLLASLASTIKGQDLNTAKAMAAALQPRLVAANRGGGQIEFFANLGVNADIDPDLGALLKGVAAVGGSFQQALGKKASLHGTGSAGFAGIVVGGGFRLQLSDNQQKVEERMDVVGHTKTNLSADAYLFNGLPIVRVGGGLQNDVLGDIERKYEAHRSKYKEVFRRAVDLINKSPYAFPRRLKDVSRQHREKARKAIRSALLSVFSGFDRLAPSEQNKRCHALLNNLLHFSGNLGESSPVKETAIRRLAEHESLQVRNYLMNSDRGARKMRFSGASVGIGLMGGVPFVDASIGWKSYGRTTYVDTVRGNLQAEQAEWTNKGKESIETTPEQFVAYLNEIVARGAQNRAFALRQTPEGSGEAINVDQISIENGMIYIPETVWYNSHMKVSVHNKLISNSHVGFVSYPDSTHGAKHLAIPVGTGMSISRAYFNNGKETSLYIGTSPGHTPKPSEQTELRRGVEVAGFVDDVTNIEKDNIPGNLSMSGTSGESLEARVGDVKTAFTAFARANPGLFDPTKNISQVGNTFKVPVHRTWISSVASSVTLSSDGYLIFPKDKDLSFTKVDGKWKITETDWGSNGFDIYETTTGVEILSDSARVSAINNSLRGTDGFTDYQFTSTIDGKFSLSRPGGLRAIVVENLPVSIKIKSDGTYDIVSSSDGLFSLTLEGPGTSVIENQTSLGFDVVQSSDAIEEAAERKNSRNRWSFTLGAIGELAQGEYVDYRNAMDNDTPLEAIDKLRVFNDKMGHGDLNSLLNSAFTDRERAEMLSYFEGLYSSVSVIKQTSLNTFDLVQNGSWKYDDFGDLVDKRTNGLMRHFSRERFVDGSSMSHFSKETLKDARMTLKNNLGLEGSKNIRTEEVSGVGLVIGYNRYDNVEGGIAEKYVANPRLITNGSTTLTDLHDDGLKKYYIENILDSGVHKHLLQGTLDKINEAYPSLSLTGVTDSRFKDLLLGNKIDGIGVDRDLKLGFFGRCCNETLMMTGVKVDTKTTTGGEDKVFKEKSKKKTVTSRYHGGGDKTGKMSFLFGSVETDSQSIATGELNVGVGFSARLGQEAVVNEPEGPDLTNPNPGIPTQGVDSTQPNPGIPTQGGDTTNPNPNQGSPTIGKPPASEVPLVKDSPPLTVSSGGMIGVRDEVPSTTPKSNIPSPGG